VFAGTSGALMVGRWLSRRRGASETEAPGDDKAEREDEDEASARKEVEDDVPTRKDDSERDVKTTSPPKRNDPKKARMLAGEKPGLEGFVCQLGDVVMRLTGEEAWLAGGVILSEDVPVAVLYVAPDAGHNTILYARWRSNGSLLWLAPLDPSAILVGG